MIYIQLKGFSRFLINEYNSANSGLFCSRSGSRTDERNTANKRSNCRRLWPPACYQVATAPWCGTSIRGRRAPTNPIPTPRPSTDTLRLVAFRLFPHLYIHRHGSPENSPKTFSGKFGRDLWRESFLVRVKFEERCFSWKVAIRYGVEIRNEKPNYLLHT